MSTTLPIHEPLVYDQPIYRRKPDLREKALSVSHNPRFVSAKPEIVSAAPGYIPCKHCKGAGEIRDPFRQSDQVWECMSCGTERAWGFQRPDDAAAKPALGCKGCKVSRRHAFARVA